MRTSGLVGGSRRGVFAPWYAMLIGFAAACAAGEPTSDDEDPGEGGTAGDNAGGGGEGGIAGADSPSDAGAGGNDMGGAGGTNAAGGSNTAGTGGSNTAGTGGSNTAGSGGMPPASGTCATNLFCDDFESATAMFTGYTKVIEGEATVSVDESKAHSGKRSVKIVGKGDMGSEGSIAPKQAGLLPLADTYMRMMVYLDKAPSGSKLHWTWLRAVSNVQADTQGKIVLATTGIGGHPTTWQETQLGLQPSTSQLVDCWNHTNDPMPIGKWACVEYHLKDEGDQHEVWVDGQKVAGLSYNLTPPGNSFGCLNDVTGKKFFVGRTSIVRFGWRHAHQLQSPVTLWIDDIAIDSKRIGCPSK